MMHFIKNHTIGISYALFILYDISCKVAGRVQKHNTLYFFSLMLTDYFNLIVIMSRDMVESLLKHFIFYNKIPKNKKGPVKKECKRI